MNLLNDYVEMVERKKALDANILEMQKEIYIKFKNELDNKATGVFNLCSEGFKIKITKKETITVDQDLASMMNYGFKVKYSVDKKEYKNLSEEQQKNIDDCVSTKPAKPSFAIEREE